MKNSKSLFQVAAEKYTTMSSDLKETKKTFLQEAGDISAPDLNAAYTKGVAKTAPDIKVPAPATTNFGPSNPGGSENPRVAPEQPQQSQPGATGGVVGATGAGSPTPTAPSQQQLDLTKDPTAVKVPLDSGDTLFRSKTDPNLYYVQPATNSSIRESVKANVYTVEDIMSALTTLSTGDVVASESDMSNDLDGGEIAKVKPAGDVLATEDDESSEEDGLNTTDEADDGPNVDQAGEMQASGSTTGNKSTVGKDSSWTGIHGTEAPEAEGKEAVGTAIGAFTGSGLGAGIGAAVGGLPGAGMGAAIGGVAGGVAGNKLTSDEDTSAGDKTGVDDSYTAEAGDINVDADSVVKGAANLPQAVDGLSKTPGAVIKGVKTMAKDVQGGALGLEGTEEPEMEGNPSGKESAFWVPNDDMLGLKDIVGTVAQKSGVPNTQEAIGKDAAGNLVKKPTTPVHSTPNMRQYVKTNPMPGQPMRVPGQQPVDISDLDSVMGMDTSNDRALNISMNFNF